MREILFRGKTQSGEWVEGVAIFADDKSFILNNAKVEFVKGYNENHLNFVLQEFLPETVGQYTGLTDKNGKKIFEGDICQTKGFPLIDEKPFVIEWNSDECSFYWRDAEGTDEFTIGCSQCTTVIGNIHDNPELLKGE